jgi:type I restriction enzyme, S subunit
MNRFPSDWQTIHMKEAATWLSGGTPSTSNPQYWDGDIPWISAASLKNFRVFDSERRVTSLGAAHGTRLIPEGTTIFVVRGMSLKNEFRVGITCREVAFGQDCKALIPAAGVYPPFLAFAVAGQASSILKMVDEAGHGTGRLPTDQLLNLPIGIPPIFEQKRIVEILDTADDAIQSAERLITKLEQAKQGLRHDLLTRGIDESGELRDPATPGTFVNSELGLIPCDWRIVSVADTASKSRGSLIIGSYSA